MNKPGFINKIFPFLGMVGFFLTWLFTDIYIATMTLMAILTLQIVIMLILKQKIQKVTWATFLLVVILGSMTVYFREKAFIQMKTTVVYSIFAFILLVSDFIFKRNLVKMTLRQLFVAPDFAYRRISSFLAVHFFVLATVNWYIATYYSEAIWFYVKTFAFPASTMVIIVMLTMPVYYRYAKDEQ